MHTFSLLEAQSLKFPELVFSFEFDFKKLNLGRGYGFLKNSNENLYNFNDDYIYFNFLKNTFLKNFYDEKKLFEIHILTNFITSLLTNYTRFLYTEKFSSAFLEEKLQPTKLFPDILFSEEFYEKFKYRWLFFGFTKNLPINSILLKNNNTTLNILLFYSRMFINSCAGSDIFEFFYRSRIKNLRFQENIFFLKILNC